MNAQVLKILEDRKRREIAEKLNVTEHTVKKHTAHIFSATLEEVEQAFGTAPSEWMKKRVS